MGITIPKLPKIHPFSFGGNCSASGQANTPRKLRVKKLPIEIVPPPEWVEKIGGYFVSSCIWHDSGRFGGCFVVEYVPNDRSVSEDRGFVKIYASDYLNGTPFVQMKGIWKDLYEDEKTHSITYDIAEDGKIYNCLGGFPSDDDIRDAIYDIGSLYDDWKDFPNVQDWDTVCKLREAKMAVDDMRVEEKYGRGRNNIDNLRKKIKEIQTQIAEAEKNLNEMYEKAADGMNLLEEHGVEVDLDAPSESKNDNDEPYWFDDSALRNSGFLTPMKSAHVMRNPYGGCSVQLSDGSSPKLGDIAVDANNGLRAVYAQNGEWNLLTY